LKEDTRESRHKEFSDRADTRIQLEDASNKVLDDQLRRNRRGKKIWRWRK
jgi:hypothetical protein